MADTVVCPRCMSRGNGAPITLPGDAEEFRCDQCRRHFQVRTLTLSVPVRQLPVDDEHSRYLLHDLSGEELRFQAPPGLRLPAGARLVLVYDGIHLQGIAHQQDDRWIPLPHHEASSGAHPWVARVVLGSGAALTLVLAAVWVGAAREWVGSASPLMWLAALLLLSVLLLPLIIDEPPPAEEDTLLRGSPDRRSPPRR